ncbi:hypothetical protein [Yersinia similis]|nr:hypothetical protein [Yersinia similis]CFQ69793.1 membrane protein [Yersinia similis]CNC17344.1 membrane protein [Yersinia similis]CNF11789.1 membrane protein [Yersinia similis]CNF99025.1 membrane protein [Yersinia similis]CNI36076.1 membrane protein [Yersinia similis]
MQTAKLSASLLATGGILGYGGAYWQMASLLIVAGIVLLAGLIASGFTDHDYRCK